MLQAKPPPSKWLVAPGPLRRNSHFAPTIGRLRHFSAGATETGSFEPYWTYTSRWSCRFSPTPGRSATTSMPSPESSAALPTPDSWSSCGELIAPPDKMSSADLTRLTLPSCRNSTPTARVPSKMILVAKARVATVRFGLLITGYR